MSTRSQHNPKDHGDAIPRDLPDQQAEEAPEIEEAPEADVTDAEGKTDVPQPMEPTD